MRRRLAYLPLHGGKAPLYLFQRTAQLAGARVPRYFEWNKFVAKARNPKPEIRKKSEGRSPKGANSAAPAAAPARRTHASPPLGDRPVLRSTPTESAVRSGATAEGGPTRISDF